MTSILVGIPSNARKTYCFKEFIGSLRDLLKETSFFQDVYELDVVFTDDTPRHNRMFDAIKKEGFECIKIDNKKEKFVDISQYRAKARNTIRQEFLLGDWDYLQWLDVDVLPPTDLINRLLDAEKDVVAGVYWGKLTIKGEKKIVPLVYNWYTNEKGEEELLPMWMFDFFPSRLIRVQFPPMGCSLITRKVMGDCSFHWQVGDKADESTNFFIDVARKGYELYVDSHLFCKHYHEDIR